MRRRNVAGTLGWSAALGATAALALALPAGAGAAERGIELISPAESLGLSLLVGWGSADVEQAFFASDQFSSGMRVSSRTSQGWTPGRTLLQSPGAALGVPSQSVDGTRLVAVEGAPNGPEAGTRTDGIYLHAAGQPVKPLLTYPNPGLGNPNPAEYYGADEDVRRLYLKALPGVVPGTTSASGLYRWNDPENQFDAVEIDDPRVQACGSYGASFPGTTGVLQNGISADGRRVIISNEQCTVPGSSPLQTVRSHLYLWEDGVATDISRPLAGEADGAATFIGMSPSADRIFFRSSAKLTADAVAGVEQLYIHESGQTTLIGLPAGATLKFGSAERPVVSGDGSSLWYIVNVPGGGPQPDRLFRWRGGASQQIAEASLNGFRNPNGYAEVSRDGSAWLLRNAIDHAGYGTAGTTQLHRFGADGSVDCVSCPPAGVPVQAIGTQPTQDKLRRPAISADGSAIAFDTPSAISPQDVNGSADVYLWKNGTQTLLSSGTASGDAEIRSMSWDASSVYFASWGALVPGVSDPYRKLYVSRVGGGFPPSETVRDCGDSCQGAVTPQPVLPLPGSPSFVGPGNVVPPKLDEPQATGKVRATRPKTARGTKAVVRVRVPGKGQIRTSGWGLKRGSRKATRSTTYRVNVRLTSRATRTLRRKGTVKTRVTVRFTPAKGKTQTVRVAATFKRSKQGSSRAVVRGEL
ncbi:MAG: hypothetical protein ITG02_00895 [Patulibacter sp.]|nr:hypothetical protein [Patulibacter sp.]